MNVDGEIVRLSSLLDERVDEYRGFAVTAAEAEAAFKVAYAKEYINATGTVQSRSQLATVACEDLLYQRMLSEGVRDACVESMRSIRAQLSALQTLAANERAVLTAG